MAQRRRERGHQSERSMPISLLEIPFKCATQRFHYEASCTDREIAKACFHLLGIFGRGAGGGRQGRWDKLPLRSWKCKAGNCSWQSSLPQSSFEPEPRSLRHCTPQLHTAQSVCRGTPRHHFSLSLCLILSSLTHTHRFKVKVRYASLCSTLHVLIFPIL